MRLTDPIADLLVRVRNAIKEQKKDVDVPFSNLKKEIVQVLSDEGYIAKYETLQRGVRKLIRIALKYDDKKKSLISKLERVSKPGRRYYVVAREVYPVQGGFGTAILSTSQGVLTDEAARRKKLGGELLLRVW